MEAAAESSKIGIITIFGMVLGFPVWWVFLSL